MKIILLFIFISTLNFAFAQSEDSTIYNDLNTLKFYSVNLYRQTRDGKTNYELNGRKISKRVYKKYKSIRDNIEKCTPCILETYDENDVLLRKGVSYQDCGVGRFETFHPNGELKSQGSYKENPTGDWTDIWNRGYCNIPIGKWSYFNEKGEFLYADYWENGEFIKQVPEQKKVEVWDIDLYLNDEKIDTQAIPVNQIGNLKIVPKYKNKARHSTISYTFEISAVGFKQNKAEYSTETFKKIDVTKTLQSMGIPNDLKTSFILIVFGDGIFKERFYLNVKK